MHSIKTAGIYYQFVVHLPGGGNTAPLIRNIDISQIRSPAALTPVKGTRVRNAYGS